MDWTLNGDRAIWLQLKERITKGIITGEYPPGSKLPSVRELALQAGVNPNTMQRALSELEQEGLCKAQGTTGRVITADVEKLKNIRRGYAEALMAAFMEEMKTLGYSYREAVTGLEDWLNDTVAGN